MPVREFLRGGYQKITEPTVVMSRGYPKFTVFPGPPHISRNKSTGVRDSIRPGPPGPSPNGG